MQILNRKTINGPWPVGSVYVGRGTSLGNPYVIGEHGNRDEVIAQYRDWLRHKVATRDMAVLTALAKLTPDSNLVCSCSPAPCHAEIIRDEWGKLGDALILPPVKAYAGIGARKTPPKILDKMRVVAERMEARGYVLRSGAAEGADSAFEAGVTSLKEIFLPWPKFNDHPSPLSVPTSDAMAVARAVHPAWDRLSDATKKLQARNSHQILGMDLRSPVSFVICWTPDGCESELERNYETGGTGQAIALANRWKIPVFNMAKPGALDRLRDFLNR